MTEQQYIKYFIKHNVREYQAKKKAKVIIKWDKISELSNGVIYNDMRKIGVDILESFKIEAIFWGYYDKIHPPTPWEQGMINFTEGKSKLKYNEIPLI
jgi:hypothetical protein